MRTAVAVLALAACSHDAKPAAAPVKPQPAPALTPDLVLEKVRGGYMTGVQRCYTRYLKNASGHGRVVVMFTVNAKGEATEGAASGVPAKLGDCIVAEVARWRFPAPKDGEQSFALPLELIAN
jgi:hypothetical protein